MKSEISYGVIPLQQRKGEWWTLLILHRNGEFWCFPKGHGEEGESPQETAQRELKEEVGLHLTRWLSPEVLSEQYTFQRGEERILKRVEYFLALVEGEVEIQEEELLEALWLPLNQADKRITFPEGKRIAAEALSLCKGI